jgi:uncharacterized protein (TIGR03546 family)
VQSAAHASVLNAFNILKIGNVDSFRFTFFVWQPMFPEQGRQLSATDQHFFNSYWDSFVQKNLVGAMILRISRSSNRIVAVLSQHRGPSQIAWGVAIGIMIGLIPKDNLIAISLVLLLAFVRVNQLVACVTALAISLLGGWFLPITMVVGTSVLDQPMIANGIAALYRIPVLPWTCLDNAQVVGGMGVGTVMLFPAYVICLWAFGHVNQKLENIALEQVANDAIQYRKSVIDQSKNRNKKPAKFTLITVDDPIVLSDASLEVVEPVHSQSHLVAVKPKAEPAAIKKHASRSFGRAEPKRNQSSIPTLFTGEVLPDGCDTYLRETVIEVVRYRRPTIVADESVKKSKESSAISLTQGISMTVGNTSTMESKIMGTDSSTTPSKAIVPSQSLAFDASHYASQTGKSDESLKYLLWHINGARETVRKSSEKTA